MQSLRPRRNGHGGGPADYCDEKNTMRQRDGDEGAEGVRWGNAGNAGQAGKAGKAERRGI